MNERKPIDEMVGEALREIGTFVLVFAILDKMVSGTITGWWTLAAIAISAGFFFAGCFIERSRPIG